MAVIKVYSRINWLNKSESLTTPLGKTNLNKMDKAIDIIDDEVVSISSLVETLDTTKVSADQLNNMVTDISFNDKNGVISITKYNGTTLNIDTAIEKIAVNFEYDAKAQQLIITLESGEKQYIDMSALVTQYEFKDTDTIAFSVDSDGKVSASVKNGSITKAMLSSDVMASITLSENNAAASAKSAEQSATNADMDAKLSQSYSIGKSGIREDEDTDNAKYYYEQSKTNSDTAVQSATNAATSESNAKSYMESAKQSENTAVQSAESAVNSEGVAAEKASEAEQSATNAKQSETNIKNAEDTCILMSKTARSYAVGDTDFRENEATDNAKYYYEQAKVISAVDIATTEKAGIVKPDGITITVDEDGTIHGSTNIDVDSELSEKSENPVQNKAITKALENKANTADIPKSLPANGGDSSTVNGHTVESDVPANAKFTDTNTTYSVVTTSTNGLMSKDMLTKLNSIETGANKITVLNSLTATTTGYALDAAQGKVLNDSITSLKKSVSDGKSAIASAITNKGVSTASDASFSTMATNIGIIADKSAFSTIGKLKVSQLMNQTVTVTEIVYTTAPSPYCSISALPYNANAIRMSLYFLSAYCSGYSVVRIGNYIIYDVALNSDVTNYIGTFSLKLYNITNGQTTSYTNVKTVPVNILPDDFKQILYY